MNGKRSVLILTAAMQMSAQAEQVSVAGQSLVEKALPRPEKGLCWIDW